LFGREPMGFITRNPFEGRMCDFEPEEFAEYLRYGEAAHVPVRGKPRVSALVAPEEVVEPVPA